MAEPSKPSPPPVGKPGVLPRPDQLGALPDDVMNWERKSLDANSAPPPEPGKQRS